MMLSWAKATNSGYNYQNKAVRALDEEREGNIVFLHALTPYECVSLSFSQFFSLSPSEIGLLLELLDARMSELSLTHSPNMNAGDDDKAKRVLSVVRSAGADGLPNVVFKFAGEIQAGAALNAGEARALRVRTMTLSCTYMLKDQSL